jgi:hypothetical protein
VTHWQAAAVLTMTAWAGAPSQRPGAAWQARTRRTAGSLVRVSHGDDSESRAPGCTCLTVTELEHGTVSDQGQAADGPAQAALAPGQRLAITALLVCVTSTVTPTRSSH